MKKCNNCGNTISDNPGGYTYGLAIRQGSHDVADICAVCLDGTKMIKLVLRREANGDFCYEQYTAIEMVAKAFGK